MLTYPYVEDYLEYLGGYEVGLTALITPHSVNRISLARYDIAIVNSMASTTVFGTALTDKQAELAVKLVLKYRRQFAKLGIDVGPAENPVFRLAPRKMDRTKAVWLDGDHIVVKFPYDNDLIKELQNFREESQGRAWYDRDKKLWNLAITEYNVNWIVPWAHSKSFDIDHQIQELLATVLECEQQLYEIKLVKQGNGYTITNASTSLNEYIELRGGFGQDNLVKLIDYAGLCGYDIDDEIKNYCMEHYPTALVAIGSKHSIHLPPSPTHLNMIFDYAEITDRYPVCIYNPTLFEIDLSRFDEEEIVRFDRNGKTKTSDYDPYRVKVVYAGKIPATWDFPVPLMVTTFEMMFGGRKMDWTRRAEKIIYYGATQIREHN
jgi:hypothetical protein